MTHPAMPVKRIVKVSAFLKDRLSPKRIVRSFLFAMAALCLAVIGWFMLQRKDSRLEESEMPAARIFSTPQLEQARKLITYLVKPGDTFAGILTNLGVTQVSAETCYRSLSPLGLKSLFPGDSVVLGIGQDGSVDTMSLLNRLQYRYHLAATGSDIRVERKPIIISTYECMIKGELSRSLSEDLFDLGAGDALVAKTGLRSSLKKNSQRAALSATET
jgi:hypothetical protein